jgi:hypothetical protein
MANTWGQSGTTWGQNQWGDQADVDVSITAPTQLSTTLGTVIPFNELGWGSDTWGTENWGASGLTSSNYWSISNLYGWNILHLLM